MAFLDLLKRNRPKRADQRRDRGDRGHRPRRGPPRGGRYALAREIRGPDRRGDGQARDGRAGVRAVHQVRPAARLRRDVRRPRQHRARPDLGLHRRRSPRKSDPAGSLRQQFDELAAHRRAPGAAAHGRGAAHRGARQDLRVPPVLRADAARTLAHVRRRADGARTSTRESPILRGVLLHQRHPGGPPDRPHHELDGGGVRDPAPAWPDTTPQVEAKSYFLGELFQKVIFPDKNDRAAQRGQACVARR